MKSFFIQYGCGLSAPIGWQNYDASPTLRLQRIPVIGRLMHGRVSFPLSVHYGDIVKGLPVEDCSSQAVYCSHVLEHLSLTEFKCALVNTYKLLMPGGVFRLVMPDLESLIETYRQDRSKVAAVNFMKNSGIATEIKSKDISGFMTD